MAEVAEATLLVLLSSFGGAGGHAGDGHRQRVGAGTGLDLGGDGHSRAERFIVLHADAHFEFGRFLAGAACQVQAVLEELAISVTVAVELAVLERVHLQPHGLADLDQDDVHFTDVDPGFHRVQVRDGHDIGAGHGGGADDAFARVPSSAC